MTTDALRNCEERTAMAKRAFANRKQLLMNKSLKKMFFEQWLEEKKLSERLFGLR